MGNAIELGMTGGGWEISLSPVLFSSIFLMALMDAALVKPPTPLSAMIMKSVSPSSVPILKQEEQYLNPSKFRSAEVEILDAAVIFSIKSLS